MAHALVDSCLWTAPDKTDQLQRLQLRAPETAVVAALALGRCTHRQHTPLWQHAHGRSGGSTKGTCSTVQYACEDGSGILESGEPGDGGILESGEPADEFVAGPVGAVTESGRSVLTLSTSTSEPPWFAARAATATTTRQDESRMRPTQSPTEGDKNGGNIVAYLQPPSRARRQVPCARLRRRWRSPCRLAPSMHCSHRHPSRSRGRHRRPRLPPVQARARAQARVVNPGGRSP